MQHWTYEDKRVFSRFEAWVDLILNANHKDTRFPLGNEIVEAKRGDVITSELKLMERWGWSKTKLRNFLELLEKDGMIVKKTDRKKTTINIVNYGQFQPTETTERPRGDRGETAERPREDTINNVNNVNKEIINTSYTSIPGENPFSLFITHKFGTLDSMTRDFVGGAIDDYSERWVMEAMKEAVKQGKISWKYVEKILSNWKPLNHLEPWTIEREKPQPSNVTPMYRQRSYGQHKAPLPVVDQTPSKAKSAEEREALRKKAQQLDGAI